MFAARPLPLTVVLALIAGATGACTKVREQPAPIAEAPREPAKIATPAKPIRRPASSGWASAPAPARPPAPADAGAVAAASTFSHDKLQAALEAALPGLAPCWPYGLTGAATISFDATADGKANKVRVAGASSPAQEKCVVDHVAGLQLPRFEGPDVGVQLPITVGAGSAPAGRPAATATEPAPRLFVNP
jgi:hypothetical protein